MFEPETVLEKLVELVASDQVLVTHFKLEDLAFLAVRETNVVSREVYFGERGVLLKHLREHI